MIAIGLRRYGFDDEADTVMRQVCDAASYFLQHQLPELYSGLPREPDGFPVQYLGANTPQAWAAGSCFAFLQTILGFAPDAPGGKLYLDPHLPDWMPTLTVRDLRAAGGLVDIAFWRDGESTRFEVLKGDPEVVEQKSFATRNERWL
jgi:glycogen debranching enzyme